MGKIGDYIHYHAWNYKEYGVSKDTKPPVEWKEVHTELLRRYLDRKGGNNNITLTKDETKQIEQYLNKLKNNESNDQNIKIIQDRIFYKLQEQFKKAVDKIDWSNFTLEGERKKGVAKADKINLSNIELLLNKINQLQDFLSKTIANYNNGSEIKNEVNKVKNQYLQLLNITQQQLQKKGWAGVIESTKGKTYDNMHKKGIQQNAIDARKALQELIDKYAAIPPYNLVQGTLFEYALAILPEVAYNKAVFSINEIIEKRVKGNLTEKVKIDQKFFATQYMTEDFKKSWIKTESSQGKVDVQLEWNSKKLNISAKNVSIKDNTSNIHILSGSSLLFLLQDVDSLFVNHYLNLFATHKSGGRSASSWITLERQKILNQLRLVLFIKALTGMNQNRKTANVFIVNDTQGHGIKIVAMQDLIKKIKSENILISANGKGISQMQKFKNNWKGHDESSMDFAQNRITELLKDVHSRKISVAFRPSVLYDGLSSREN